MTRRRKNRITLLAALLAALLLPLRTLALARPDPETPCTLTLTAEFAPSGADLGALNAAQDLAAAADAFARFVSAEHLVPCAAETTDAQGGSATVELIVVRTLDEEGVEYYRLDSPTY